MVIPSQNFFPNESAKVKNFIQTYCCLSKDKWAGKPLQLIPWQSNLIDQFFGTGTYNDDFFERSKSTLSCWISKKNGKSSFLAALILYLALEKRGNEVIVVAPTIQQAKVIYREAAYMSQKHPELKEIFWTRDHLKLIQCRFNNSSIQIVACNDRVSGYNGDVICDEFGEFPPSIANQVWEKIQDAGASRLNSCLITISTANFHMGEHPAYQWYLWCKEVLKNPEKDPSLLPIIYECPPELWEDESGWKLANPSLGYCLRIEELRKRYKRVKQNPRSANGFKMLRLGIWCGANELFIDPDKWRACKQDFKIEDLYGCPAYCGFDASRRIDLTAFVLGIVKDDLLYLIPRFFTPKDIVARKEKIDQVPYRDWKKQGFIHFTSGDTINQDEVVEQILRDSENFDIQEIRYDPNMAHEIMMKLDQKGLKCVEVNPNPNAMAPSTNEFERMVLKTQLRHNNPILDWNVSNAVVKVLNSDSIIVSKKNSTSRIDGLIASILAVGGYMESKDQADVGTIFSL